MNPTLAEQLMKNVSNMQYRDVLACMMHPNALKPSAPCLKHGQSCLAMRAILHVAGCPCLPWSQFGSRGGCSGESLIVFMTWVAHRRRVQESGILTEHVEGMTPVLWNELFGNMYIIDMCIIDSNSLGQLQKRVRRLVWMRHKRTIIMSPDALPCHSTLPMSFEAFVALFHRVIDYNSVSWMDLLFDDDDALEREFKYEQSKHYVNGTWNDQDNTFEHAMSGWDFRNLKSYNRTQPNSLVQVMQAAIDMPLMNNGAPWLQTVISNCGCLWSTCHGRWLAAAELLVTQGSPVYDDLCLYDEDLSWHHTRTEC